MKQEGLDPLPPALGWPITVAGLLAVFATYWDESLHTDIGRDSAWAAPHVLLYGSVAIAGMGVAWWGIRALVATRSLRTTLAHPPLLAAGLGGLGALVAAPIDAVWHETYGRDAVLWSPPHMLVVLASTALVMGVLAGLPADARALRALAGVLLVANAAAVVFEYEADVPQFSELYYLPTLLLVGLFAAGVVKSAVPVRRPVLVVVLGYAVLRLLISGGLIMLGRSTPDLPVAVLGLAAFDLPLRRTAARVAAAAAATSALAWAASAGSVASIAASDVAVAAIPVVVVGLLVLLVHARRGALLGTALVLGVLGLLVVAPERVEAHDPGQGDPISRIELTATTGAGGVVILTARAQEHCDDLRPQALVGRRAGSAITAPLLQAGRCTFGGEVTLPSSGRWFVYAQFVHADERAEAWLPVDVGSRGALRESRYLYTPAGEGVPATRVQIASGLGIYVLGLALLAIGVRAARSTRVVLPRGS